MKRLGKKIIPIILFTFFESYAFSQPGIVPPGCDPMDHECICHYNPEYDSSCPIDGGVIALLAAGVGYGLKRVRDSRKKDADLEN